jgi:tetratricopeptide (TPR) repeat protein
MSNQNFSNNPFIQNPQDPNFQFNQSVNNNYNPQNPTPTTAPGMYSGGMPPMNQNIPPIPPVPPMNPKFPPMPPMRQNKSSSGLIIAIVAVLVLLLVSGLGIGGFVYWNNLQKQQSIEKNVSVSINNNLEKYNTLTEQSIQDLENLSKAVSSVKGSNFVEDFIRVVKDNKNALTQIEQKHQDLANNIDSADQESVQEFNKNLKKEIENAKQVITSSKILYETAFCYISSVNDLDKSYLALPPLFNKLANSASSNQDYINITNQILDEIRKMETASQATINCLEQNPNFGSPTLISNLKSAQQDITQMKQGLEIFKSGVQNNKINDVERGSKIFLDALSKLNSRRIDQSSLPDMPKETEKTVNEYKQRVSAGKKALEEKKNQILEKARR